MDCEILRTLYAKSNGEVLCNDDYGERVRLGRLSAEEPGWSFDALFGNEHYRRIRTALARDQVPWDGVCQRCAFLRRAAPTSDTLAGRHITKFQLEPSLACNLVCPACSNPDQQRLRARPHVLPVSIFRRALRSLRNEGYTVDWIEYCGQGEPLMHPRFSELVAAARDTFPGTSQRLITNGNFDYQKSLGGRRVDEIYVSCDGVRQRSYEQYRQRGDVGKALRFMRDVPRRVEGRRQRLIWKYILFEFNDSDQELIEAQAMAEELSVDRLQFTLTDTIHRSTRFTLENAGSLPVVGPNVSVEPCAAYREGAHYGDTVSIEQVRPSGLWGLLWPRRMRTLCRAHVDQILHLPSGAVAIRGWAGATADLTHVALACDGEALGTAKLFLPREDVFVVHPNLRRQPAGFQLNSFMMKRPRAFCILMVDLFRGGTHVGRVRSRCRYG